MDISAKSSHDQQTSLLLYFSFSLYFRKKIRGLWVIKNISKEIFFDFFCFLLNFNGIKKRKFKNKLKKIPIKRKLKNKNKYNKFSNNLILLNGNFDKKFKKKEIL